MAINITTATLPSSFTMTDLGVLWEIFTLGAILEKSCPHMHPLHNW